MPRGMRVPEYEIRVTPQASEISPMANVAAQTVDIEATEKLGTVGTKAGNVALDIFLEQKNKIQDEESRNWTLKARPEFKAELDKIESEYAGKINGFSDDTTRQEYIKKSIELSEKYKTLAGSNNISWKYLQPHMESDITAAATKLGALSKATRQIATESGLQQNFGIELGHAKDDYFWYDGKNFSIESRWKNVVSLIMGSGLDPDDKQKKLLLEKPRFYQEYAQLMLGDPKTAGQFADVLKTEGAFNAYMSHLPQGSQGDFTKALQSAANGQVTNQAYRDIFKDSMGDPQKAIQILNTPEALDKYKIDTDQQKSLEANFSNALKAQVLKDQTQETANWGKWLDAAKSNSLTYDMVRADAATIINDQARERHLREGNNFINSESRAKRSLGLQEKSAAREERRDNLNKEYAKLLSQIVKDPYSIKEAQIITTIAPYDDTGSKSQTLINFRRSQINETDPYTKEAYSYIDKSFPKRDKNENNRQAWADARTELEQKKRNLEGVSIQNEAEAIVKRLKDKQGMNFFGNIVDYYTTPKQRTVDADVGIKKILIDNGYPATPANIEAYKKRHP